MGLTLCACAPFTKMSNLWWLGPSCEDDQAQEASGLGQLSTYQDQDLCHPALPACHLENCQHCNSLNDFKDKLLALFSESMINEIQYKQWVSTDRLTLETLSKPTDEIVEHFCEKLRTLKKHYFIAKQQSSYCTERKDKMVKF